MAEPEYTMRPEDIAFREALFRIYDECPTPLESHHKLRARGILALEKGYPHTVPFWIERTGVNMDLVEAVRALIYK